MEVRSPTETLHRNATSPSSKKKKKEKNEKKWIIHKVDFANSFLQIFAGK